MKKEYYENPDYIYNNVRIGLKPSGDCEASVSQPTEFTGIDQYLYVVLPEESNSFASFKIKDWMLERFDLEEEYLWARAASNTRRALCIMKMSEALGASNGPEYPLIISNKEKMRGASAVLFARAALDPGKYIALPSSVHEFLLVPDEGQDIDEMSEMVKTINATEVLPEDRLSDRAYRYEVM